MRPERHFNKIIRVRRSPTLFTLTSGPTILDIADTTAQITWTTSQNAQGFIEYGTSPGVYPSSSTPETSFTFATHVQVLSGLAVGTTYYFRTVSTNNIGEVVRSSAQNFTTDGVAVPGTIYNVPTSIDATGATTVNVPLQAWLNSLPNGTAANPTIALLNENGRYDLASGGCLMLNNRQYFYLYGKHPSLVTGATSTVEASAGAHIHNRGGGSGGHLDSPIAIGLHGNGASHHVKVMGLELSGTWPNRGAALHDVAVQSACGVFIYGATATPNHDIEVAYNFIHEICGHFLYWRGDNNLPYGLNWHHNVMRYAGTMGLAVSNGQDITMEDNYIEEVGINSIDFEDAVYEGANPTAIGSAIGRYQNIFIRRNRFDKWGWDDFFQPEGAIYRTSPGYPMATAIIEDNDFYSGWQDWTYPGQGRLTMSTVGVIAFWIGNSSDVQIRRNYAHFALEGRFIHLRNVTGYAVEDNTMVDLVGANPNGTYTMTGDVLFTTSSTGGSESGSVIL